MTEESISIEMMELEVVQCLNINDLNSKYLIGDIPPSVEPPVKPSVPSIGPYYYNSSFNNSKIFINILCFLHFLDSFKFVENELFHFLNVSLEGKIILGKYKSTRNLDYSRLKDLLIFNEINKDPICFK